MLLEFPSRPATRATHVQFRRHIDKRFFVIASIADTDEGTVVVARELCSATCTPDRRRSSWNDSSVLSARVVAANDGPATTAPVPPPLLIIPPPYTPGPRLVS